MSTELDPNFKRVFSFELLLHRIENTKPECEQYSKILLEKTIAGLDVQGKIATEYTADGKDYIITGSSGYEEIAKKLTSARKMYLELTKQMGEARADVTTRSWMDGKVLEMCHLIDAVIYPVAMSQGLLDQSQTLEDFRDQFANKGQEDDE